jgi:ribosomal protein S18 acetylase RimI-like enzyme
MTADYAHAVRAHIIDLMIVDENMVGLIELAPEPECLLIVNVAVLPTERGNGYGHALMAHAVDIAQSLDRKRIRLYTNKLMAENIALYKKLGYAIDREELFPDGREAVHMSLVL